MKSPWGEPNVRASDPMLQERKLQARASHSWNLRLFRRAPGQALPKLATGQTKMAARCYRGMDRVLLRNGYASTYPAVWVCLWMVCAFSAVSEDARLFMPFAIR